MIVTVQEEKARLKGFTLAEKLNGKLRSQNCKLTQVGRTSGRLWSNVLLSRVNSGVRPGYCVLLQLLQSGLENLQRWRLYNFFVHLVPLAPSQCREGGNKKEMKDKNITPNKGKRNYLVEPRQFTTTV